MPVTEMKRSGIEVHEIVYRTGGVAQLGEHLPCKQGVKSSNLSVSIVVNPHYLNIIIINAVSAWYTCSLTGAYSSAG